MPAPFVIATIPLATAAKTIPVWVSVAVTAGMAAISIGYKYLTQPKGIRGLSKRDWDSNIVSTEQYLPVIYGKARIGISPIFINSGEEAKGGKYDNKDWLFGVGAVCHGEIESIEKVVLNNEEKNSIVAKNENGDLEEDEFYQGNAHFGWKSGKSSGVTTYRELATAFPKWNENHLGLGVASMYMNLKYSQEKFPAGVPNFAVIVKGKKVHDPRNASYPNDTVIYSTNPALCVLDYLKSDVYGGDADDEEIDLNSFIVTANYCDQLLTSTTIDPPSSPLTKLIDTGTNLYTGSNQQYSYKYAFGTLNAIDEDVLADWTILGSLSAAVTCTVTKSYGAVRLSGIDTNSTYSRLIFRKDLNSVDTYKLIGHLDPDDTSTIYDDNTLEADLGEDYAQAGDDPGTPGAFTATFRDFTASALDASKFYKYKIVYKTATGEHTEAGDASSKVKTKGNKKAIKLKIPISEDIKVTQREIYRTHGYTSGYTPLVTDYKLLATLSNNTQETYIDLLADPTGAYAPTTNNTTVSQVKMFTCNGIVDTSRDILANLEELLSSCRGRLFYESGKYTIAIRTTTVPEVFELTEDNIIGDWNYRTPGTKDVCNVLKASWTNPDQNWQTDYVIWPHGSDNNLHLGDDYGFKVSREIDLPFTTSRRTARQIAQVTRKETRQNITVTLTAKEEALKLKANTVVKVTHSSPGWTGKLFWVDAIKILPNATVGLALTEYDATVYNYEIIAADTLGGADTTLPDPNDPSDEVTSVVIVDEMYGLTPTEIAAGKPAASPLPNWRLKITYTDPAPSFWHHSDVYVKKGDVGEYIQMGTVDINSRGVFYIYPVEPFIPYYIKFLSISDFGPRMLLDDATQWSHTISPAPPNLITSLSSLNKGNDTTTEGKNFVITWAAVSQLGSGYSKNSTSASIAAIETEELSYDIEVRLLPTLIINGTTYPGISDSILLNNGEKVNTQLLNTYTTDLTEFTYTYEKNIIDINKLFSTQTTNINYEDFYGHAQRTLEFRVYTKNRWGKRSSGYSSIKLHNSIPAMVDIDGNTITPEYKEGLSSLEFSWEHPFAEIDITHFMCKLVGKAISDSDYDSAILTSLLSSSVKRENSTAYAIGDFVFPKPANGHCYRCHAVIGSGKTASTQPVFAKPSDSNGAHPTTTDNNVTWKHYCLLRFQKVTSSIDSDNNEDDISATSYTAKFQNLDPKKSFRFKVTPHDVYGAGTMAKFVSATPGTTHDITEDEDIGKPAKVTGTDTEDKITLTINSNNNVVITWNKPNISSNDSTDVVKAIIDWRARQGVTGTPVLTLRTATPTGDIPTLGDVDTGYYGVDTSILVIGEKKSVEINIDEDEAHDRNRYIIKGAKVGYTYFAKVRFENSSKKQGSWSDWNYNAVAVSGLSSDDFDYDFKKYIFSGTFSATDIDTVSWGTGTLQFKNTDGTTSDKTISNTGNTGNMTEAMWIVWPGDAPNANTKFKALTSAQYLAATGKTPIAFAQKGDTGQLAFYARFSDKKDFMVNASFIAAGSIVTAHLAALSVEASKMNINGTLTMGHSSGAKMLFLDNNSVNRIKIAATNGGVPKMVVTKTGYNADTEEEPDNLIFSTAFNYFKIIESALATTVNFSFASGVSAGNFYVDYVTLSITNNTIVRGIVGFIDFSGYMRMLPITDYTSMTQWEFYEIIYDSGASPDEIRFRRTIFNNHPTNTWTPGARTKKINWYLLAETLAT